MRIIYMKDIRVRKWYDIFYTLKLFHNKIYYIPHYLEIQGKEVAITKLIRDIWIDKLSNNKKGWNKSIYCIYGELSSIDTIKYALDNKINVNVIFGNQIASHNKSEIKSLKDEYNEKLRIYSYEYNSPNGDRPQYHSTLIGRNLFFESYHEIRDKYKKAKIIEYADKATINEYKRIFNYYLSESTELTSSEISSMNEITLN